MPHQQDALERMHDGCILCGGVGSGKSYTALYYYKLHHFPKKLIVITTARKRDELDWQEAARWFLLSEHEDSTTAEMVVDSWNNIEKYVGERDCFFIFDEQRVVGYGKWAKSFLKITKANKWILLSATPGDVWMDYVPVFIANGFYRNKTDFVEQHVQYRHNKQGWREVQRYFGVKRLERQRDRILVLMPYRGEAVRHIERVDVEHNKDLVKLFMTTRRDLETGAPVRTPAEFTSILRRLIYTHGSRLDALWRIAQEYGRVIVFYNYDFELTMIKTRWLEDAIDGFELREWNGHIHEQTPDGDKWVYLVQYMAGAEAWECTTTNCMVFFSQTHSYKMLEQAMGRIDRMNTGYKDLYYYTLRSNSKYELAISRALEQKKQFNEGAWGKAVLGVKKERRKR